MGEKSRGTRGSLPLSLYSYLQPLTPKTNALSHGDLLEGNENVDRDGC